MRSNKRQRVDEPLNRADVARLVGILLVLAAFLMLTFTPQLVFEALHHDGYVRTEAEVLSPSGRSKSIRVRIIADGTQLYVRRTSFQGKAQQERVPVWYNPQARVELGITLFDTRVISSENTPELPQLGAALSAVLINLLFGCGGAYLLWSPTRERQAVE